MLIVVFIIANNIVVLFIAIIIASAGTVIWLKLSDKQPEKYVYRKENWKQNFALDYTEFRVRPFKKCLSICTTEFPNSISLQASLNENIQPEFS